MAFAAGQHADLGLCPSELRDLGTVNVEQLMRTAEHIARGILRRKHRGSGGLVDSYRLSLGAWRAANPSDLDLLELSFLFMESSAFGSYRERSPGAPGIALEEAFYLFLEEASVGQPATREREFLTAMTKLVAVNPHTDIRLPSSLRRTPRGFMALSSRGEPMLYAVVGGSIVIGGITPFMWELLASSEDAAVVARRHACSAAVLKATLGRLHELGVVA